MPIYEFYCPDNHTLYSFLGKSSRYATVIPRCPANPSFRLVRMISDFAALRKRAQSATTAAGPGDLDDARMESAMAQMEREFSSINPENPDPRELGRMMRRMAEVSGEKVDGRMEEVFRRLEEGADPESLEQEYGDLLAAEPEADEAGAGEGQANTEKSEHIPGADKLRLRLKPPRRDPNLYEFDPLP